jgi:two-component system, LytTR family, sensor kinase
MRFGEKLKVQIFRASGTDGWLVPMSLQLLLENVAKHNAISSSQPIDVRIRVDHDHVSVTNTVVKRTAQEESTGVGLNYLSERYASLGGEMIVSNGSNTFEVILPILKSEM